MLAGIKFNSVRPNLSHGLQLVIDGFSMWKARTLLASFQGSVIKLQVIFYRIADIVLMKFFSLSFPGTICKTK